MASPDAEPGYKALFPAGYDWPNEFLPRGTMTLPWQRPWAKAKRVAAPLLVQVMTEDVVTPPEPARKAARMAPRGELGEYPGGHFDIYLGEPFERAVTEQIAFLDRHLTAA
jgi:pimeloyl-ACP methyl ester carboxylesterase